MNVRVRSLIRSLAGLAAVICACQEPSGTADGVGPDGVAPPPQPPPPLGDPRLARIELPQGFHIRVYAAGVDGARSLSLGADGTLFVGTRSRGRVYALRDEDGDHKAERVITLARGLNSPNGVAFKDGDLYVAEISRILRYPDIEANLDPPPRPEIVNDGFPTDGHHGWKFIRFRTRRPALRSGRGAVQHLRCRRSLRVHRKVGLRWQLYHPGGGGSATPSASTGTRKPGNCGSPTTAETGWVTIPHPTS